VSKIIFRDAPGVWEIEQRVRQQDRLFADELRALIADIDRVSVNLFGITELNTEYSHLPFDLYVGSVTKWEEHFDFLEWEYDEEQAFWDAFELDVSDG
jgi:hypothetical protein